jgi:outer membrane protein assembly factor BamB/enterochelin esterase-like enzyme
MGRIVRREGAFNPMNDAATSFCCRDGREFDDDRGFPRRPPMTRSLCRAAMLLLLVATQALAEPDSWSSLRGPNHDGSAPGTMELGRGDGQRLVVAWRASLGPGCSSVAVHGDRAVTLFSDGTTDLAAAFDVGTGREIWRRPLAPTYKGHDGSFDGPLATPAVADGRAFVLLPLGDLVALDLASGKEAWRVALGKMRTTERPYYGYASSPVVAGGSLVVQLGAPKGLSVVAFDMASGKTRWSLGEDGVNYQTPVLVRVAGRDHLVAAGDTKVVGVDPASGRQLWEHAHGGDASPIAALSIVPVPAGEGRLFLRAGLEETTMVQVAPAADGTFAVKPLWKAPVLRMTYAIPVYHDGYLYGYNGRILTCVDAATGELKWRSREPGDGFLARAGSELVILTKAGTLHVGAASPAGWAERERLELFKDVTWAPPSFGDGAMFLRSHGEIARVQSGRAASVAARTAEPVTVPPSSRFGRFLAEVAAAPDQDKAAVVDRFLAGVTATPLVEEPDLAVFLYRGEAKDVAIAGDMIGQRREDPMTRVPGTNLSWYAARLERDAVISYYFQVDFDEQVADPRNPRRLPGPRGPGNPKEISYFGMPGWREPAHLTDAAADRQGRIETHEVAGPRLKSKLQVHVPAGYDTSSARHPVAYVMSGEDAVVAGRVPNTLAHVQGTTSQPVVTVFVGRPDWGQSPPKEDEDPAAIEAEFLVKEVIPFVDAKYRTVATPAGRAAVGQGRPGFIAATAAFGHPGVFGGLGLQSVFMLDVNDADLRKRVRTAAEQPLRIYLDWGLYDMRGTREGWDNVRMNRGLDTFLRERGYAPVGGETHEGFGWASWRNRTDKVFGALFPL